jgi:hypothetical protein
MIPDQADDLAGFWEEFNLGKPHACIRRSFKEASHLGLTDAGGFGHLLQPQRCPVSLEDRVLLLSIFRAQGPELDDELHDFGIEAVGLGLGVDIFDVVGDALLLFGETLDAFDEEAELD